MTTPSDINHPHSIYGASGSSRWRLCPGSVRVIAEAKERGDIPTHKSDAYADEGTEAHDWATKVLTDEIDIGEVPDEFREYLTGYIGHCRNVEYESTTSIGTRSTINEKMVPLFYRPQDRGTVDHAVVCLDFIHITDLKYGAGVKVEAGDNDQAQIYAISLIEELEIMDGHCFDDDTPVYLTIYQPRHHSFTGDPDTWELTVGQLRINAMDITTDYKIAMSSNGDLFPSDKACQFCDAKAVCVARAKTSFGGLPVALSIEHDFDFETDTKEALPAGKPATAYVEEMRATLTPGQIAFICKNGATIKKVIEDTIKGETKRLLEGGDVRQMKLVAGKLGNRIWVDPKAAETFVRGMLGVEESYKPRQLITAPQALAKAKAIKGELSTIAKLKLGLVVDDKAKTKSIIHRPDGNPKLVSIEDTADALNFTTPADDFDIEEE